MIMPASFVFNLFLLYNAKLESETDKLVLMEIHSSRWILFQYAAAKATI